MGEQAEIDMASVGKADAIIVRLVGPSGQPFTILIDGGNSGNEVLDLLGRYHDRVDLMVSTHSDHDHIQGLIEGFDQIKPRHLLLNDPGDMKTNVLTNARTYLDKDQRDQLAGAFDRIELLKSLAILNGTNLVQCFAANQPIHVHDGWMVTVVGPTAERFRSSWAEAGSVWTESESKLALIMANENIDDDSDTQPLNKASVMILIEGFGKRWLFTGDAGKINFYEAMQYANLAGLSWLDVPHHGSRRNLNTEIIGILKPQIAYISSAGTDKHPNAGIITALKKSGSQVYSTCRSGSLHHRHNITLERSEYVTALPW